MERVARPFRDAYGWATSLFDARSENERLRAENEQLQQQVIQNESALQRNVVLEDLLDYKRSLAFPADYDGVAAEVIARPSNAFEQTIVVSAGSDDGIAVDAPVVTAAGLVGTVTSVTSSAARVRLLTDEASAVSALDLRTSVRDRRARPVRRLARARPGLEEEVVNVGDEIVTAGWRSGRLASRYPKGIVIGRVSFVGQLNTDLWQQVLIVSDVDFSALDSVLVLVPRRPAAGTAVTDHVAVAAIVFVAALLQVTLVSSLDVLGGTADVLLLSLLAIALLRGS